VQQGQAFFTAAPAPAKVGSGSGSGSGGLSKTAAAVAKRLQSTRLESDTPGPGGQEDTSPQEEIVGMMEDAVGETAPDAVKSSRISSANSNNRTHEGPEDANGGKTLEDESGFTYDSDSSRESRSSSRRDIGEPTMPDEEPLRLPFPHSRAPIGIGASPNPLHFNHLDEVKDDVPVTISSETTNLTQDPHRPSPFVQHNDAQKYQKEKDSWFLVQLPTRLPPLHSVFGAEKEGDKAMHPEDAQKTAAASEQHAGKVETADVATKPVKFDVFDNSLSGAVPGKMGKIQVHKSGKTVLILQASDGSEIRMNISEGLACSFQQQAAMIDIDKSEFVSLGSVGKTLVVSPNLDD